MSDSSKWKELERQEANYETNQLIREMMTGPVIVALGTLTGPVGGFLATLGWGGKAIYGRLKRERERRGE